MDRGFLGSVMEAMFRSMGPHREPCAWDLGGADSTSPEPVKPRNVLAATSGS